MEKNKETQSPILNSFIILIAVACSQGVAFLSREKGSYLLNYLSLFAILVQWVMFLPCSGIFGKQPTEKYYDLIGSVSYISSISYAIIRLKTLSIRQVLTSLMGIVWSVRLGAFLFSRISRNKGIDDRFENIKKDPMSFFVTWTIQGLWVFLTSLGILIICQKHDDFGLNSVNYIGIALWVFGFSFEVVADMQKSAFRSIPENKNKWISTGLWSISRHPNYFGEITLWLGVALVCIQELKLNKKLALLFISPIFVAFLLNFVSGIPILEKNANRHFGNDEEYKKYKKQTAVLIPFIY